MKISNIQTISNLENVKGGTCGSSYSSSYSYSSSSYSSSSCCAAPSGSFPGYTACAPPRPPAAPHAPVAPRPPVAPCAPVMPSFCFPKISFGCGW